MPVLIIDTGPLVALLNPRESHHEWIVQVLERVQTPLLTCESVISEACFLLNRTSGGPAKLMELITRGVVIPSFDLHEQADTVAKLMVTYTSVPMALADACLVRMSEIQPTSKIITLDSDFKVYRRKSRQVIPTIMPD